jgi:hypothetical protein
MLPWRVEDGLQHVGLHLLRAKQQDVGAFANHVLQDNSRVLAITSAAPPCRRACKWRMPPTHPALGAWQQSPVWRGQATSEFFGMTQTTSIGSSSMTCPCQKLCHAAQQASPMAQLLRAAGDAPSWRSSTWPTAVTSACQESNSLQTCSEGKQQDCCAHPHTACTHHLTGPATAVPFRPICSIPPHLPPPPLMCRLLSCSGLCGPAAAASASASRWSSPSCRCGAGAGAAGRRSGAIL